jgi:hypothetical protein
VSPPPNEAKPPKARFSDREQQGWQWSGQAGSPVTGAVDGGRRGSEQCPSDQQPPHIECCERDCRAPPSHPPSDPLLPPQFMELICRLAKDELGPVHRQHRRKRGKAVEGRSRAESNESSGVEHRGKAVKGGARKAASFLPGGGHPASRPTPGREASFLSLPLPPGPPAIIVYVRRRRGLRSRAFPLSVRRRGLSSRQKRSPFKVIS